MSVKNRGFFFISAGTFTNKNVIKIYSVVLKENVHEVSN